MSYTITEIMHFRCIDQAVYCCLVSGSWDEVCKNIASRQIFLQ